VDQLKTIALRRLFLRASNAVLELVYPPEHQREDDPRWRDVSFLDDPCCVACGFPFEFDVGVDSLCARCSARRPSYDRLRSAFAYDDGSRRLVLGFKHGGRTQDVKRFAIQMRRVGRSFWATADWLVPVPLHTRRLIRRRYNQAAILANALAGIVNPSCRADILFRHKATISQGLQTASGRFRNVQGAFSVPDGRRARVEGKNIVLIDDVFTTGATLEACARTLRRAGAETINAVTLARVVKNMAPPS